MRLKLAPIALFSLSVVFGSAWTLASPGNAWAKGGKGNSDNGSNGSNGSNGRKKSGDETLSRQFKWEEGVVGSNDKKLDHDKIAAMQAAARREEASHKNEPTVKKTERPAGVGVPASSTLPTMDIEKPAPVSARPRQPHPTATVEPPRRRDSLDALLDSEKDATPARPQRRGDGGLGKVLAVGDTSAAPSPIASAPAHAHQAPSPKAKGKRPHRH